MQAKASLDSFYAKQRAVTPPRSSTDINRYSRSPLASSITPTDSRTVYTQKQTVYHSYYSNPPVYITSSPSSFGMWDAMFLWALLDNHDSRGAYDYQNDDGYRQWRDQADRLARDNAELRDKLAALDARTQSVPAGTPADPKHLPEGYTAADALALDLVQAAATKAKICGGVENGQYNAIANLINVGTDAIDFEVISTNGTTDNLNRIQNGTCDFALVQEDGIEVWNQEHPATEGTTSFEMVASLFEEETNLLCAQKWESSGCSRTSTGVKTIGDLGKTNTVALGTADSGSTLTWKRFVLEDSGYGDIKTILTNGPADALLQVRSGHADCAFIVMGANGKVLRDIDAGNSDKTIRLAAVDDTDLDVAKNAAGDPLYRFVNISSDTYRTLGPVETIAIKANLIVSPKWKAAHPKEYAALQSDILAVLPEITQRVAH